MTEEEKLAEEYADKYKPNFVVNEHGSTVYTRLDIEQAFLEGYKAGKENAETDLATIAYMQGASKYKDIGGKQLTYAKTIIQDLLDNTDEYARQRAEDFLKENK